jgi:hypothetical protein
MHQPSCLAEKGKNRLAKSSEQDEGKNSSLQPLRRPFYPHYFGHSPHLSIAIHKNVVLLFSVVVFYLGDGQFELQDKKSLSAF